MSEQTSHARTHHLSRYLAALSRTLILVPSYPSAPCAPQRPALLIAQSRLVMVFVVTVVNQIATDNQVPFKNGERERKRKREEESSDVLFDAIYISCLSKSTIAKSTNLSHFFSQRIVTSLI